MGVFDTYCTIGKEAVAYGTLAGTFTRGIEILEDPIKHLKEYRVSNGMRPGFETTRADRRRGVDMGGEGTISVHVANEGHGMLLEAAIGTAAIVNDTPNEFTFVSSEEGPTGSLSVQVNRGVTGTGSPIPENALGGMVKSWELTQKMGGEDALANLKLMMDYREIVDDASAASATYPTPDWIYGDTDCTVTVGGSGCFFDVTLTGDNGLNINRRCLDGDALKEKPYRNAVAQFGGAFTTDYTDDTIYDLFRSGDTTEIVVEWAGPNGSLLRFTYAAAQIIGDSPVVSVGSSTQSVPWVALDNGTDPAVKCEYFTVDSAV
jgi:hypothetical protein